MRFSFDHISQAKPLPREESVRFLFGCKFYCGSDTHQPITFMEAKGIFERAIDWLELEESDKLDLSRL